MNAKPKRRWYQFSLRILLVLVTVIGVTCGWYVHRSKEWIKQRQAMIDRHLFYMNLRVTDDAPIPSAPGGLWLFGEKGLSLIVLGYSIPPETVAEVRSLFPEAKVQVSGMTGGSMF